MKRGTIQDETREDQAKTHRSRPRRAKSFILGYKLHSKVGIYYTLIREIETTTTKVQDGRVGLSSPVEVVLRDKGCFWG